MTINSIKNIHSQMEHLMYGYNYEVTFGIDIFDNCTTLKDFKLCLKARYPDSKPENIEPISVSVTDFWDEIKLGLDYRGDKAAGLKVTQNKEEKLEKVQAQYISLISQFINAETKIYSYPDEKGIPGYPVFWDYRFIVFTDDQRCLFVYGAASD